MCHYANGSLKGVSASQTGPQPDTTPANTLDSGVSTLGPHQAFHRPNGWTFTIRHADTTAHLPAALANADGSLLLGLITSISSDSSWLPFLHHATAAKLL